MFILNISFSTGFSFGLCAGGLCLYIIRKYLSNFSRKTDDYTPYSSDADYRIILVVRTDLNMGKGKIAAQCGHASVGAIEKAQKKDTEALQVYRRSGQMKIALRIDSESGIKDLATYAKKMGLVTSLIRDAGRTQIAANSITVLAIGPAPKDVLDKVTGHLKPL